MPFNKGQSGNPAGRPKGARDKRTLLFDELAPYGGQLIAKAVALALEGDPAMIRLCLDKLIGNCKPSEPSDHLPDFAGSLSDKGEKVLDAIAAGTLTPAEGQDLLSAITNQARILETDELLRRIEVLEHAAHRTTQAA